MMTASIHGRHIVYTLTLLFAIGAADTTRYKPFISNGTALNTTLDPYQYDDPINSTALNPTLDPSKYDDSIPIYIGGVFAYPNNPIFGTLPYTVQTAINHVNNLTGILDGYELKMRSRLTNGQPNDALVFLNDLLYEGPTVLMTWGPILSRQALIINEVASHYNLVQVCLANSQALRDRERYPLTVQMYWSENSVNPARVAFMHYMHWTKVAIIFEDIEYFRTHADDLRTKLEAGNIHVITVEAISDTARPDQQLRSLKRHDARIIFSLSYFDTAIKTFCKVYEMGMFGVKYVWSLPGWYPHEWWEQASNLDCSQEELLQVLQYHVSVSAWRSVDNVQDIQYNHIKPSEDQLLFLRGLLSREGVDRLEHIESYEVLMTIALALNHSIEKLTHLSPPRALHDFTYSDEEMSSILLESVMQTRFVGPTGSVLIEDGGYRSESTVRFFISQFQDGKSQEIIEYFRKNQTFGIKRGKHFHWKGTSKPVDGVSNVRVKRSISGPARVVMYTLSSFGIVLSLFFLFINIKCRKQREIKISTPLLNNLIVLGSIMLYVSVFVYGVDESKRTNVQIIQLYFTKLILVCVGISLGFGSLFMKTYRIHAIFSRAVAKLKQVDLPNSKLVVYVFLVIAVDVVIFVVWICVGETTVDESAEEPILDLSREEDEIYIVYVIPYCTSQYLNYFKGAFYLTKGILLAFGTFLAWETRNISVSSLNDSKYIGMSIYMVAVLLAIVTPLLNLVNLTVTTNYLVLATSIIIANTTVLCLVFLPKIFLLYKSAGQTNFKISMMTYYLSTASVTALNDCRVATALTLQENLEKKTAQLEQLQCHLTDSVSRMNTTGKLATGMRRREHQKEEGV